MKGKRRRGRQKKSWEDNVKQWAEMDFAIAELGQRKKDWGIRDSCKVIIDFAMLWDRLDLTCHILLRAPFC